MKNKTPFNDIFSSSITAGEASHKAVDRAEFSLNVKFPKEYRDFLEAFGALIGDDFEIAGVFDSSEDEPPIWKHIVNTTKQFRRMTGGNISNALIPISDDGSGKVFYLDTSNPFGAVYCYGPGLDGKKVAESFKEFVVKLANGGRVSPCI
ncbi:MAG: SMI1/KNR4 family protein [Verrucomicrobia bacterium]|nr:SMI1/KNR4 family protein [Verrucomicrobiota bacterium]MCH8510123.1 SMI1/KNR4 family protein [Kiritimatiellia bacterium]